MGTMLLSPYVQ